MILLKVGITCGLVYFLPYLIIKPAIRFFYLKLSKSDKNPDLEQKKFYIAASTYSLAATGLILFFIVLMIIQPHHYLPFWFWACLGGLIIFAISLFYLFYAIRNKPAIESIFISVRVILILVIFFFLFLTYPEIVRIGRSHVDPGPDYYESPNIKEILTLMQNNKDLNLEILSTQFILKSGQPQEFFYGLKNPEDKPMCFYMQYVCDFSLDEGPCDSNKMLDERGSWSWFKTFNLKKMGPKSTTVLLARLTPFGSPDTYTGKLIIWSSLPDENGSCDRDLHFNPDGSNPDPNMFEKHAEKEMYVTVK